MSYLLALTFLLNNKNVQAEENSPKIQEESTKKEEYSVKRLSLIQEGDTYHLCTKKYNYNETDDLTLDVISKLSNISIEDLETKRITYSSYTEYYHDILEEEYCLSKTIRSFQIYEKVFNKESSNEVFEEKLMLWGESNYYWSSTGNFYHDCFTFTPETQTEYHLYHPMPEEKINFHYSVKDYFDTPTITKGEAEEFINNLNNNQNRTRKK